MYAIVDIETTGGYAAAGGITEIAVFLFDGERIIRRWETLINPAHTIPRYVEALTGITNEMVEDARPFSIIAPELFALLKDNVFVAHNVNFDYSFIKYHLAKSGLELNCRKLCTIRLARQIFPGMPSYSLGNLCSKLEIVIEQRHRAGGDAEATVRLFKHLLENDHNGIVQASLKAKSKQQSLPANLSIEQISKLPAQPGVYYFHDQKGKVIYVGKAKNLVKRVNSHFTNNNPGRQKQEFLRKVHNVTFEICGTELMAFILENIQIKKLWPEQNRSQKRFDQTYALYSFTGRNNFIRLAIEKKNKTMQPLYTFNLLAEGHILLRRLVRDFQLCPKLCFLQSDIKSCSGVESGLCLGACEHKEPFETYNNRVNACIDHLNKELPTFALIDDGKDQAEQSCILIEKGSFYGMGYYPQETVIHSIDELKSYITRYNENDYIRGLVHQHVERFPGKKRQFAF